MVSVFYPVHLFCNEPPEIHRGYGRSTLRAIDKSSQFASPSGEQNAAQRC